MYGAGAGVDNNNQGPVSRQFYGGGFFERGRKQYELSNHLGNVLTTISDRKFGVSSGAIGSLIDYYEPDIVSANDYYPFGMVSRVGQTTTGGSLPVWLQWQGERQRGKRLWKPAGLWDADL